MKAVKRGKSAGIAALHQVVLPKARDRWIAESLATYTPSRVESILRSALTTGDLQAAWRLYDLMEASWPRLAKDLKELKDAVVGADWSIQPWTAKGQVATPEASARAQALEAAIWSMTGRPTLDQTDFRDLLFDLLDAWGKGISVVELLWELRELPQIGTLWAPASGLHVNPIYYGYPHDSNALQLNGRELGLDQSWVEFPPDKFLIAIAKQKSGHPAGSALLRSLAWWWCAGNFSAGWFLNFAQIFGLPIRWANYDPNSPGVVEQICDMLENMGSAGWGAFPAGTTIELKEPSKGAAGSLPQEALLDRADRQCDLLVLGQTLTTDVADSGSRALGDVHADVLTGRKQAAADWLGSVLTAQLASSFCRLNYGDTAMVPQFVVASETVQDPLTMAQRDEILQRMGVEFPREFLHQRHGVPLAGATEDVIARPQPAPSVFPGQRPEEDDADAVQAKDAGAEVVEPLVRQAVARVVGARERWLAPIQEELDTLVRAIQNQSLDDRALADFAAATAKNLPDLFARMDINALADALEDSFGAAAIKGVKEAIR